MQTKLTLRLDDLLIQQAKTYAKQHGKSLSQVVSGYFQVLTKEVEKVDTPPMTKSLIGILDGHHDIDVSDYKRHLEEKFL